MENPFKYGGIGYGPYFADCTEELANLVQEMKNLSRGYLVSPRRFGKTCLLFNFFLFVLAFCGSWIPFLQLKQVVAVSGVLACQTVQKPVSVWL